LFGANTGWCEYEIKEQTMAQSIQKDIHFKNGSGEKVNDATLHVIEFDQSDSTKRALKRLGLFWLLAVLSVPIIFAHWVLVPAFFIAGPVMAVLAYKTKSVNDKASGVCPECAEHVEVKFEARDTLPKWTYCPSCNKSLTIDE
jgi:hypothetical protein